MKRNRHTPQQVIGKLREARYYKPAAVASTREASRCHRLRIARIHQRFLRARSGVVGMRRASGVGQKPDYGVGPSRRNARGVRTLGTMSVRFIKWPKSRISPVIKTDAPEARAAART